MIRLGLFKKGIIHPSQIIYRFEEEKKMFRIINRITISMY